MKNLHLLSHICIQIILCSATFGIQAQERSCGLWLNEIPFVADTTAQKLYVTLEPEANVSLKGTFRWDETIFQKVSLNGTTLTAGRGNFVLSNWRNLTNILSLTDKAGKESQWKLVCTTLPIILLEADQEELYNLWKIDENIKHPAFITAIDARHRTEGQAVFSSFIGIRIRGATSAGKAKKSFAVELRMVDGSENDIHLLGYRNDGDWILDAMFNDYARMRNRLMMDVWNAIDDLPYGKDNNYQCNGTQGEFVEVFMKGRYHGLYCFSDKIDRKKLNLKKTKEATGTTPEVTRGLLWKAMFSTEATRLYGYEKAPSNDTLVWEKYWEQHFPEDRQDQANFTPIANMIDIVGKNSSNNNFTENLDKVLYMDNVINYLICAQAFQWMDNLQKNYYLSIRDVTESDQRMLITPWDLDAIIGRDAGGDKLTDDPKWLAWGENLGGIHHLIFRLSHLRPNDFATQLNNRWQYLKTHALSVDSLRARMTCYADLLNHSGAWEREREEREKEAKVLGKTVKMANSLGEEINFMCDFLTKNYAVFDKEVASWNPAAYEPTISEERAIYIVAPDRQVEQEGNVTTLPGTVVRELVDGIQKIDFANHQMILTRATGTTAYDTDRVKEVRTQTESINATTAFIPTEYKSLFDFDTQYGMPDADNTSVFATTEPFTVQRTLRITFDNDMVTVVGNAEGCTINQQGASLTINSSIEGMQYVVSGTSGQAHLVIRGENPALVTFDGVRLSNPSSAVLQSEVTAPLILATRAGTNNYISGIHTTNKAIICGEGTLQLTSTLAGQALIKSDTDIQIKGGVLNLFTSGFDGKGLYAHRDVIVDGGSIHIITAGDGTQTDDALSAVGVHAILGGRNVYVNGGKIGVKTLGYGSGVGIAAIDKVVISKGEISLACFDDPINAINAIEVSGGKIFTSSLVDDGMDTNGNFLFTGGTVFAIGASPNEGAFDNDGKTFTVNGGTIIGIGTKSDYPQADKSIQAALYFKKGAGVKKHVRICDAQGVEVTRFETPAYAISTLVYSSPLLVKGQFYTFSTSTNNDGFEDFATIKAE